MAPTKKAVNENTGKGYKSPLRSVAKDVSCSQSAVFKICKQNGKAVKGKHTDR